MAHPVCITKIRYKFLNIANCPLNKEINIFFVGITNWRSTRSTRRLTLVHDAMSLSRTRWRWRTTWRRSTTKNMKSKPSTEVKEMTLKSTFKQESLSWPMWILHYIKLKLVRLSTFGSSCCFRYFWALWPTTPDNCLSWCKKGYGEKLF